jgi:hypothetical protein
VIGKTSIGVAFIGLGRMGETHLRNVASLTQLKVLAVADSRHEARNGGKLSRVPRWLLPTSKRPLRLALAAAKSRRENRPVKISEITE